MAKYYKEYNPVYRSGGGRFYIDGAFTGDMHKWMSTMSSKMISMWNTHSFIGLF